ncbi:TetR/AcrR family transcriptional regulator [Microbacterium sp. HMH0099]|uniref:TetR/AcrR family transcriptional regulator n=1 Tax=Microbacterium sp. HMH0099 TaxID=3414026 RepID=UPI001F96E8DE|nr:TetR/AcrR family transcriptional regulator [Actinomycetota bacterium]
MAEARRDAERTRSELLSVATEVFAEDGFSGARVDEIAARTRTTKRMIYYYFGGKEGLYRAVLEEAYRGIREAERTIDVAHADPLDAIRTLAELTYDHHVGHDAFIRLVAIENIHRGEFVRQIEALRAQSQPAVGRIEEILERGRAAGVFRADVDALDVHLVISSYCVFQVANRYTFGHLFDVDLAAPDRRPHLRAVIGDLVVSWLTAPRR